MARSRDRLPWGVSRNGNGPALGSVPDGPQVLTGLADAVDRIAAVGVVLLDEEVLRAGLLRRGQQRRPVHVALTHLGELGPPAGLGGAIELGLEGEAVAARGEGGAHRGGLDTEVLLAAHQVVDAL